jgi:hypothetical protein
MRPNGKTPRRGIFVVRQAGAGTLAGIARPFLCVSPEPADLLAAINLPHAHFALHFSKARPDAQGREICREPQR